MMRTRLKPLLTALTVAAAVSLPTAPAEARAIVLTYGTLSRVVDTASLEFSVEMKSGYSIASVHLHGEVIIKLECKPVDGPKVIKDAALKLARMHDSAAEIDFPGFLASAGFRACIAP